MPDVTKEVALLVCRQASRSLCESLQCPHCAHVDVGMDVHLREDGGNYQADFKCRSCQEVVITHPVSRTILEFLLSGRLGSYSINASIST